MDNNEILLQRCKQVNNSFACFTVTIRLTPNVLFQTVCLFCADLLVASKVHWLEFSVQYIIERNQEQIRVKLYYVQFTINLGYNKKHFKDKIPRLSQKLLQVMFISYIFW